VFAAVLLISILALTIACRPEQSANSPGGDIDLFKAALEEARFKVQEGAYGYQDAIALCSAGVMGVDRQVVYRIADAVEEPLVLAKGGIISHR
jgi:hypothetical protein